MSASSGCSLWSEGKDDNQKLSPSCPRACIFCYKITSGCTNKNSDLFFKILERFVGQQLEAKLTALKCGGCCENCGVIISSFCQVYHQLRILELQLEWKLGSLVNIIKLANRVPSRIHQLRCLLEDDDGVTQNGKEVKRSEDIGKEMVERKLKLFKNLRSDLVQKCSARLSSSQPRVLVKRRIEDPAPSFSSIAYSSAELILNIGASSNCEEAPPASVDVSKVEHFLGWILSFAAVAMVASLMPGNNFQLETVIPQMSIDEEDVVFLTCSESTSDDENEYCELSSLDMEYINKCDSVPSSSAKVNESSESSSSIMDDERKVKKIPKNETPDDQLVMTRAKIEDPDLMENNYYSDGGNDPDDFHHFEEEPPDSTASKTGKEAEAERIESKVSPENVEDKITSMTPSQPQRYSLRGNRKRSYKQMEDESETFKNSDSDPHSNYSSSSSSDSDDELTKTPAAITKKNISSTANKAPATVKCDNETPATTIKKKIDVIKNPNKAPKPVKCDKNKLHKNLNMDPLKNDSKGDASGTTKYKRFSCPKVKCKLQFATGQDLEGHEKLHGKFKCNFCDISKKYAPNLAIHESEKHAIRPEDGKTHKISKKGTKCLSCSRCPYNSWFKANFLTHFLETHLDLQSPASRCCPICKATSRRSDSHFHRQHFKIYHDVDGLDPTQIHSCYQCPAYFIKNDQLIKHLLTLHYKKTCPNCGKIFKSLRQIRKHLHCVHPIEAFHNLLFKCDIGNCKDAFLNEEDLENHKKIARHEDGDPDRLVICQECGKTLKNEVFLKIHMKNTHLDPTFTCAECGKQFRVKGAYEKHLLYHKGPDAWKFECSECGKKCLDKYKLADHMRTHTKEKPYQCQFCGEKYAHRHNWKMHMNNKHKEEYDKIEDVITTKKNMSGWKLMRRKGSKKGDCLLSGVKVKTKAKPNQE